MAYPLDFTEKRTVLVVDDTPDNLSLMVDLLREHCKIKVAGSGERALQLIGSDDPPDLVLLDVMMPGMDGYEVARRMRADVATKDVPVIFVTAMSDAADETAGFELGAVDYITKPVSPPIVVARVKTHLALSERTRMLRELSEKLSRYLAPQVYKTIFEGVQDATIAAKRKKLTVFFSDIQDFTATTEDLQPEDLTYLLNKYFSEMAKIALSYGATIDKFVGDAMMAFFGDPESRGVKEDALQCVHMAITMQQRMADLGALWAEKGYEKPFRIRIGINTGFCNVGNFGSETRMDYTAIGSEVNLAARLQQVADAGGILLSYPTYALVEDEIVAEERQPVQAKGISGEVRTFAVTEILEQRDRAHRFVRKDRPGLRATLDLDRLLPKERDAALADLEELVHRIRSEP